MRLRGWSSDSSDGRPRRFDGGRFDKELLVGWVKGLITLRLGIPAYADGLDVRIDGALQRSEIQLQTFDVTLFELQPPPGNAGQRSPSQKALLILQVFITAQHFGPL